MKILAVNCGRSTLKSQLIGLRADFATGEEQRLAWAL